MVKSVKKRSYTKEYALYKGDQFIDIGTKEYLASLIGVDRETITYYATPSHFNRVDLEKGYIVVKLLEEE